jgi:hypothetical protein
VLRDDARNVYVLPYGAEVHIAKNQLLAGWSHPLTELVLGHRPSPPHGGSKATPSPSDCAITNDVHNQFRSFPARLSCVTDHVFDEIWRSSLTLVDWLKQPYDPRPQGTRIRRNAEGLDA